MNCHCHDRRSVLNLIRPAILIVSIVLLCRTSCAAPAESQAATAPPSPPQKIDCLMCHEDLVKDLSVHAAVKKGCTSCHTAIDAEDVPHKKTNKSAKGLFAEAPDLCYSCHSKAKFMKQWVHLAVGIGCMECHNPHASKNPKLLMSAVPELCFKCHPRAAFSKKNVHAPVAEGKCLTCHDPHSENNIVLLKKEPVQLCIGCHVAVQKKPHTSADHVLNNEETQDPKRPKRTFYCGSCHNPHTSDSIKLFRYSADTEMDLCSHCHNF